jgi:hypothetical protein
MHINPQDDIDLEHFKHIVKSGGKKTVSSDLKPLGRLGTKDPQNPILRSIRHKCNEIRARRLRNGLDPWQEAVAQYLASSDVDGKTAVEKAEIGRLLRKAGKLLEETGLPADPRRLTKADLLYFHARRVWASKEEKERIMTCLGPFLGFHTDCERPLEYEGFYITRP